MQLSSKYTRGLTFVNFLLGYDPRERILSRHRSRQLIAQRATPPRPHPPGSGFVGCGGDRGGGGGGGSHSAGVECEAEKGPSAPSDSSKFVGQATVDMSEPFACGSFKAHISKSTITVTLCGTGFRVLTFVF